MSRRVISFSLFIVLYLSYLNVVKSLLRMLYPVDEVSMLFCARASPKCNDRWFGIFRFRLIVFVMPFYACFHIWQREMINSNKQLSFDSINTDVILAWMGIFIYCKPSSFSFFSLSFNPPVFLVSSFEFSSSQSSRQYSARAWWSFPLFVRVYLFFIFFPLSLLLRNRRDLVVVLYSFSSHVYSALLFDFYRFLHKIYSCLYMQ